jgi:hypothetical protein
MARKTSPGAQPAKPALGSHDAKVRRGYTAYLGFVLAYPATEESTSYGTPAIKVKGKLLSRWRTEAEGGLALRCDLLDREILLQTDPESFFLTDHYVGYPWILVRLDRISAESLTDVVRRGWRLVAPAKLVERHDQGPAAADAGSAQSQREPISRQPEAPRPKVPRPSSPRPTAVRRSAPRR